CPAISSHAQASSNILPVLPLPLQRLVEPRRGHFQYILFLENTCIIQCLRQLSANGSAGVDAHAVVAVNYYKHSRRPPLSGRQLHVHNELRLILQRGLSEQPDFLYRNHKQNINKEG